MLEIAKEILEYFWHTVNKHISSIKRDGALLIQLVEIFSDTEIFQWLYSVVIYSQVCLNFCRVQPLRCPREGSNVSKGPTKTGSPP